MAVTAQMADSDVALILSSDFVVTKKVSFGFDITTGFVIDKIPPHLRLESQLIPLSPFPALFFFFFFFLDLGMGLVLV